MKFGISSMTAPLKTVAVRQPGQSLLTADAKKWHYGPHFDPAKVAAVHEEFISLLSSSGAKVIAMDNDDQGIADAVFTYDASLITPKGAVLMSPGKPLRAGEQHVHNEFYAEHNIPIIGEVTANARAEAGDTLWLADDLLAVGRGYRTNDAGVAQLTNIMRDIGITVKAFDVPHYLGQEACLHLMSLISLVDTKIALVCLELVPVSLKMLLLEMGYKIIPAPFDEFERTGTLSTNVMATSPGHCIMLDGITKTRTALERAGIEVQVFNGDALCIGCEGGPTCLTRPILRAND